MKFAKMMSALVMASVALPAIAAPAQSVGVLKAAPAGTLIARDGKLIEAKAGQSLLVGDRVITRAQGGATVQMKNCSVSLAETSIVTVNPTCEAPKSFAAAPQGEGAGAGAGGGWGTTQWLLLTLGLGAIGGGIAAATSSNTTATSP